MKRFNVLVLLSVLLISSTYSQLPKWRYMREIKFPASDTSFAVPYLCTVTASGRLYVATSAATTVGAHNAIYYADSTDTVMKLMIDFHKNGESDTLTGNIGSIRGISALNNDIIINSSVPFQRSKPSTVSSMYYYIDGDTTKVSKFGFYFSNPGHGTFSHGVAVSKDTIAFTGVTAGAGGPGPFVRTYNLTNSITSPIRGAWIGESKVEVGGTHTGGVDVIRDVALVPGSSYYDSTMVLYTSRNSQSDGNVTGGIASWTEGKQFPGTSVANYTSQRVADLTGYLTFSTNIPYGITVDKNKRLWVAGTDSLKRWVKAFDVAGGSFASERYELPSKYSGANPDTNGAPLRAPGDVALTPDALTAYVVDIYTRSVYQYKFTTATTSVEEEKNIPHSFTLQQNYPNPFNPSTLIGYTLSRSGNIKLTVSNALGQTVAVVAEGYREAGKHNEVFTAGALPSGVYFYSLITPLGTYTKKMMLIK